MKVTLYGVPASHPTACIEAALQVKAIPYARVDLMPIVHKPIQRVRFGQATVPAISFDGERVVGSTSILSRLDGLVPSPPLYPSDPEERETVVEAERFGERSLQPAVRRIIYAALRRQPQAVVSYLEGSTLPLPAWGVRPIARWFVAAGSAANAANDSDARADLHALPVQLDRIEDWIAEGVLGQTPPNAADLQIGSSLRLLLTVEDMQLLLGDRKASQLANHLFPQYAGKIGRNALPGQWLGLEGVEIGHGAAD
jgi:glutathione S-transferase